MKRHDWTRDELILALELYFREPAARGSKTHSEVIALSDVLNRLPLHPRSEREQFFRNPNGVAMKLSNFLRFDPDYEGTGLQRGNRLEEEVWNTFSGNRDSLAQVCASIRESAEGSPDFEPPAEDPEYEAKEGKLLTRLHTSRERDSKLSHKKKQSVLDAEGALRCEGCGFDFAATYGELGHGFAECHHVVPLADLRAGSRTRLSDLVILCANCHRMIHRQGGLTIEELRTRLAQAGAT